MARPKQWIAYAACALLLCFSVFALLQPVALAGAAQGDVCGTAGTRCNNFIDKYINPFIILFSGLVGVIAVISLVAAGIQYSASADDPGKVSKAKQRIFNTVIGILAYIFLLAFLNYLVPGGII